MKLLAGSSVKRSEQHIDFGPSRLTQNHTDWKRFKDWLTARNPFTFEDSNLHSLSTGFISIAGEDVTILKGLVQIFKLGWMVKAL